MHVHVHACTYVVAMTTSAALGNNLQYLILIITTWSLLWPQCDDTVLFSVHTHCVHIHTCVYVVVIGVASEWLLLLLAYQSVCDASIA